MSHKTWWLKQYFKQLRTRYLGDKVNRNKALVINRINRYSETGTRDLELQYNGAPRKSMVDGKITQCLPEQIKEFYLDQIAEQIQISGARRILEVGCGTSVNLYELSQRLPDIEFQGIDITPARIEVGKNWLKEHKNFEPNAKVGDATQLEFDDNEVDLIYTIHCFEQIDQYALAGVKEACRVAKKKVVFLEPDS